MIEFIRPGTNIDFVGKRHIWVGLSILVIILSIGLFFSKGLNYGIDFSGGAEIQVKVPDGWDIGKVRNTMEKGGLVDARVIQIGESEKREFLIKAQGANEKELNEIPKKVESIFLTQLQKTDFEIQRNDIVGPAAGASLRTSGFLSMFYAILCILVYVAIRFDMRYSPGAVLALLHDSAIVVGVLIVSRIQFDLTVLASMMALIGYSMNDTIILFDRVREIEHLSPNLKISEAVNRATNETLGRTLLTSMLTFVSAAALYFFGGSVIHGFAFVFMVGIIVGTYSSVFIAGSVLIYITEYQDKKNQSPKAKQKKPRVTVRPEPYAGS